MKIRPCSLFCLWKIYLACYQTRHLQFLGLIQLLFQSHSLSSPVTWEVESEKQNYHLSPRNSALPRPQTFSSMKICVRCCKRTSLVLTVKCEMQLRTSAGCVSMVLDPGFLSCSHPQLNSHQAAAMPVLDFFLSLFIAVISLSEAFTGRVALAEMETTALCFQRGLTPSMGSSSANTSCCSALRASCHGEESG